MMDESEFWKQFWVENREFTLSWAGDVYRTVLLLTSLGVVYGLLKLFQIFGYDGDLLALLERLDFGINASAVVIIGVLFVGKLLFGRKR